MSIQFIEEKDKES